MNLSEKTTNEDEEHTTGKVAGGQAIQFFKFGDKSTKTKLSGAEHQALQKRMELILTNSNQMSLDEKENDESSQKKASAILAASQVAGRKAILVSHAHLEKCFKTTRQSVPAEEQKRLKKIYQNFVGERDGKYPSGEASREVGARESLM
jgi:peroxin-1